MPLSCVPVRALLGAVGLSLFLAGTAPAQEGGGERQCGGYDLPEPAGTAPVADGGQRTISSDFGDVEMPGAPEAALGMYTTDVDILIWLGFPLAGSQPIRGDSGYTTFPCFFPQEALEGITSFGNYPEYNYEAILSAEPDFILNGLGYDTDVNNRLPQIAPTYSVNAFDGRNWREHFRETAEALGRIGHYEAWVDVYEARIAEVRETIDADVVVAPVGYWNGVFSSGCYVGVQCAVFADLGLTVFPGALENEGTGIELSPEEVGRFDTIDYAFMSAGIGEDGLSTHEGQMAEAANNPLWSRLGFVEADMIVPYEMEMAFGSPSGQLAFLDVVAQALSR